MINPVWIDPEFAVTVHREQLAEHGGPNGVRSAELLDSALARPQHLLAFGTPEIFDLAASYAY